MPTIAFATLGCRVNQYDTDSMRGLFVTQGFTDVPYDEKADVYIINTCSVTQMGEKKSRQLIRRAKKHNPDSVVVVTGCYAQLDPSLLARMDGVSAVVGTNEKKHVVDIVNELLTHPKTPSVMLVHNVRQQEDFEEIPLYPSAVEHTRADLKIQEGCNNFCTFCIIPYTRGALKSRQPDAVVAEAQRLADFGFKELVLTGIHLGAYGKDLPEQPSLALILQRLLDETPIQRIRMGSLESIEVDEQLIDVMNRSERICPHLHIPLQSGADAILKAMNRHYTKVEFMNLMAELRSRIHGLTLSTDLILGFPGETEALFEETLETLEALKFFHIHAFPYSPRPGTPAAAMQGQIDTAEKKRRVELVNALSARQKRELLQSLIGKTVHVLVESQQGSTGEGFSENYERVRIEGLTRSCEGAIIPVLLRQVDDHIMTGTQKEDV